MCAAGRAEKDYGEVMAGLFRNLTADEIDCRIGAIKGNGLSLLLYKDARCDMNILDETVGNFGWQRHHSRDNANCIVSIYDATKAEWIEKEDTGTESNTEAEKGLASDSFKRACFNWGIGRELYTAPFIWISADYCKIEKNEKGRLYCNDRFYVSEITYSQKDEITSLVITNATRGVDVFSWPQKLPQIAQPQNVDVDTPKAEKAQEGPTEKAEELKCAECGKAIRDQKKKDGTVFKAKDYADASMKIYGRILCNGCRKKNGTSD